MPGEQQAEEEEEEEMQEEMVLLVKGEEDEGEEKYEVVKLKIPMDNKEKPKIRETGTFSIQASELYLGFTLAFFAA
uniref:Zinc finger protein 771 n=1 Tax=Molossus molossus TaxID=27622 RepID=A0A7J8J410_MOLMO|nr:hypothetical protein HJG59_020182 [Molossus molossus]